MARVTIVFEDDGNGSVLITSDLMRTNQPMTNAEELALGILEDVQKGESFMDSLAARE